MELHPFIIEHGLDIFTTVLGLLYIWLEYKAHIALWIVGIIMPALDIYLYYSHGLYGDAGMAGYYTVAAIYGSAMWKFGKKKSQGKSQEDRHINIVGAEIGCPVLTQGRKLNPRQSAHSEEAHPQESTQDRQKDSQENIYIILIISPYPLQ
jgi:hypothetical protein